MKKMHQLLGKLEENHTAQMKKLDQRTATWGKSLQNDVRVVKEDITIVCHVEGTVYMFTTRSV